MPYGFDKNSVHSGDIIAVFDDEKSAKEFINKITIDIVNENEVN